MGCQRSAPFLYPKACGSAPAAGLALWPSVSPTDSLSASLPQMIVEPEYFRRGGNRHIWRTELCALYRRYHCLDACAPDLTRAKAGYNSILYNTVPMWAAAASRIRCGSGQAGRRRDDRFLGCLLSPGRD